MDAWSAAMRRASVLQVERGRQRLRQARQVRRPPSPRSRRGIGQAGRQHGQHDEGGRVRLGGGHGPLGARPQVDVVLRRGRHVRARRVRDGQGQGALRARRRDDPDDVGRGPRLADADDERPSVVRRRTVERVHARRGEADVEAGQDAHGVLGVDGGVVGGAPRGDDDVARVGCADGLADARHLRCGLGQEACRDLGLLADLVDQGHRCTSMPCPRG